MSTNTRTRRPSRKSVVTDNHARAVALRDEWVSTINARVLKLQETGQHVAVEWAGITRTMGNESFPNALASLIGAGAIETDTLTRILPNAHKLTGVSAASYVQAKTVYKIVNMVFTLAANDLHKLSDYTSQVLNNALRNGDALSLQGAQASLSRSVSATDLPRNEQIGSRGSYTTGTASSQASQVREVLRILGLAEVNKGRKGDTFTLNPARVQALRDLYAMGTGEGSEGGDDKGE